MRISSVALTEQQLQIAGSGVGNQHVEIPIFVEIANRHRRSGSLRIEEGRLERSVPISKEGKDTRTGYDGQIGIAVIIEIAGCQKEDRRIQADLFALFEGTVLAAEQHFDHIGAESQRGDIGKTVAIEIRDRKRSRTGLVQQ